MRLVTVLVAMMFALTASVYAQGRGNGQAKKTSVSAPTPKQTAKASARATKTETRAVKTTTNTGTPATKTEAKAAKINPNQEARLLAMLPAGSNIHDASLGFKSWGQFVAAVNASNHHNLSFVELKARMTGIPVGSTVQTMTPMSLGQALQSFKTTAPAPSRARS